MKKKNAGAVPGKKTMNFVRRQSPFGSRKALPLLLAAVLCAALFVKFGILDPLDRKTAAYRDLAQKQDQLTQINARLTNYDALARQYGRFSYGWMNDTETGMVSRMDVLELVEETIAPAAVVENLAVNNNVLNLNLHGITLEQTSTLVRELEAHPLVASVSVYTAVSDDAQEADISMSIVLRREEEIHDENP